jgi:hypothetical protein
MKSILTSIAASTLLAALAQPQPRYTVTHLDALDAFRLGKELARFPEFEQ